MQYPLISSLRRHFVCLSLLSCRCSVTSACMGILGNSISCHCSEVNTSSPVAPTVRAAAGRRPAGRRPAAPRMSLQGGRPGVRVPPPWTRPRRRQTWAQARQPPQQPPPPLLPPRGLPRLHQSIEPSASRTHFMEHCKWSLGQPVPTALRFSRFIGTSTCRHCRSKACSPAGMVCGTSARSSSGMSTVSITYTCAPRKLSEQQALCLQRAGHLMGA